MLSWINDPHKLGVSPLSLGLHDVLAQVSQNCHILAVESAHWGDRGNIFLVLLKAKFCDHRGAILIDKYPILIDNLLLGFN